MFKPFGNEAVSHHLLAPLGIKRFESQKLCMRNSHVDIVTTNLTDGVDVRMNERSQHFPRCTIVVQVPWASTDLWSCCNARNEFNIRIIRSTLILLPSCNEKCSEESDALSSFFALKSHVAGEDNTDRFDDAIGTVDLGAQ